MVFVRHRSEAFLMTEAPMDLLEDFFARHRLSDDAIEITSITTRPLRGGKVQQTPQDFLDQRGIDATAIEVEVAGALEQQFAALKKSLYKTRKPSRRVSKTMTGLQERRLPTKSLSARWIEWVLVPLAIGQFWWLAWLSLPALGDQVRCEESLPRSFVQISVELITSSFKL